MSEMGQTWIVAGDPAYKACKRYKARKRYKGGPYFETLGWSLR